MNLINDDDIEDEFIMNDRIITNNNEIKSADIERTNEREINKGKRGRRCAVGAVTSSGGAQSEDIMNSLDAYLQTLRYNLIINIVGSFLINLELNFIKILYF